MGGEGKKGEGEVFFPLVGADESLLPDIFLIHAP